MNSGGLDGGFLNQENGKVVADGVDAVAGLALECFRIDLQNQRLPAHRTNQQLEHVGRDHDSKLYDTTDECGFGNGPSRQTSLE